MSKKTLGAVVALILLSVFILLGSFGTVLAVVCGVENQSDECKNVFPPGVTKDNCPGCTFDTSTQTLTLGSKANAPVPLGYSGIVDTTSGGSCTYNGKSYSGIKCTFDGSGGAKCTGQKGSTFDGEPVEGDVQISSDGAISSTGTSSATFDSMELQPGAKINYNKDAKEITVVQGTAKIWDSTALNGFSIKTKCQDCYVISTDDERMHVDNSPPGEIIVKANGYQFKGGPASVEKEGKYKAYFPSADTNILFAHNLNCRNIDGDCISINEDAEGKKSLSYASGKTKTDFLGVYPSMSSIDVKMREPGEGDLLYIEVDGEGNSLGSVYFNNSGVKIVNLPPSLTDYEIEYTDGTSEMWSNDSCYECPAGSAVEEGGAATSFLGKAWSWITGRAVGPCTKTGDVLKKENMKKSILDWKPKGIKDADGNQLEIEYVSDQPVYFVNKEGKLVKGFAMVSDDGNRYAVEIVVSPDGTRSARVYCIAKECGGKPGVPKYIGDASSGQTTEFWDGLDPDKRGTFHQIYTEGSHAPTASFALQNYNKMQDGTAVVFSTGETGGEFGKKQVHPCDCNHCSSGGKCYSGYYVTLPGERVYILQKDATGKVNVFDPWSNMEQCASCSVQDYPTLKPFIEEPQEQQVAQKKEGAPPAGEAAPGQGPSGGGTGDTGLDAIVRGTSSKVACQTACTNAGYPEDKCVEVCFKK